MRAFTPFVLVVVVAVACSDPAGLTDRALTPPDAASLEINREAAGGTRVIELWDRCDPTTFNAALGEGTCVRREAGVTFNEFLNQVGSLGGAPAWRFSPTAATIGLGITLLAVNRGGETHTFTEVEEFGGGIVESLNKLSGNEHVAPECLALDDDDFVAPGKSYPDKPDEAGVEKYQCCIHPWMRTTVTISPRR